jgi:hypothetical protein
MVRGMQNEEFSELQLRMIIVPQQVRWPAPEYLHWKKLHEAANEARARVSEFYTLADEIDRNADLSRDGKYSQRSKAAAQAIADFEASRTLTRAREAVRLAVAKRNCEGPVSPEIARDSEATLMAMSELEKGWQRSTDKIADRASKGPVPRRSYHVKTPPARWCRAVNCY